MTKPSLNKRLCRVLASVALMTMSFGSAMADPPTFPATLSLGPGCQIWDITGTINSTEVIPNVGTTTASFTVATDENQPVQLTLR